MDRDIIYQDGCNLLDTGKLDEAIEKFHEFLIENCDDYKSYNKLGVAYAKKSDIEKAFSYFEKSIEMNPNYAPPYVNLGNIYFQNKNSEAAKEYYEIAIDKNPEYHIAYYNLAALHKANKNYEEYIKNIKKYKRFYKVSINNRERIGSKKIKKSHVLIVMLCIYLLIILICSSYYKMFT